ncbi:hypothetical protein NPIL_587001, partial [Nephila pilipes]
MEMGAQHNGFTTRNKDRLLLEMGAFRSARPDAERPSIILILHMEETVLL